MRTRVLASTVVSAVVFPLALPNEIFPMGNPFVGLIALAPLYLAYCWADSVRTASLVGVIFGGVSTFLANYWLMFFGEYSVWTIGGTALGYMMYNAILGPFLWRGLRSRPAYRPLLFALIWTAYELLKSVGFLGYPWGLAAYPFNTVAVLIQIADVTGVWGLTLVVVYGNALVAEVFMDLLNRRAIAAATVRNLVGGAVLVGLVVGYGIFALSRDVPVDGTLRVLLIQQNADSWNTRDIAGPLQTSEDLTRAGLSAATDPPDLIAWSETSLRFPYPEYIGWYEKNPPREPFIQFLADLPAPLLTGAPYRSRDEEFAIYNGAILLGPDGTVRQWYGKQQLVPFAEYVPFWQSSVVQRFFREVVGIAAIWAPGPGSRLFVIDRRDGTPVEIGTPICFEDAFSWVIRKSVRAGADLFVNLTNNAWSLTDSAQLQHLVAARFRAVETRRSLVRSTNAGFTGIVDAWGRVTEGLPMFEEGYLVADVPVYAPENETISVRWGEYFPVTIIAGLLILLVFSEVRPRRPSHETFSP